MTDACHFPRAELAVSMTDATVAYNQVEKWAKDESAPFHADTFLMRPKFRKEPKGVVLIIGYAPVKPNFIMTISNNIHSAYNYPVWLNLGPLVRVCTIPV